MKITTIVRAAILLLGALSMSAFAAQHENEKPSFHASQSANVTAKVEAINHDTREVTLRLPEGVRYTPLPDRSRPLSATKAARRIVRSQSARCE